MSDRRQAHCEQLSLPADVTSTYGRLSAAGYRVGCVLLLLCVVGCTEDIERQYGRRQGPGAETSVNGTGVLAKMFEDAGHKVFSWNVLSPRLRERADCIVWFPDDYQPPDAEVRVWLEEWLYEMPGRTLIYVGRDYDAAWAYWDKIEPMAPADQRDEIRRRRAAAKVDYRMARREIPDSEDCDWFIVEGKYRPRKVRTLDGDPNWVDGIDAKKLEIEISGRMLPSPDAQVVLSSEGDMLVSIEPWDESQSIVVANGSFLLNLPLVNHEHRKLAARLVDAVGEPGQTVVFLESQAGGPRISEEDPDASIPTGLAIFNIWPTSWIMLHLAVVGIIFCFSRWPIFGRPQDPPPSAASDFGQHIEALGELFEQSEDAAFATARLAHCHAVLHPDRVVSRATAEKQAEPKTTNASDQNGAEPDPEQTDDPKN